ncbi:hypothetical protein DNU06_15925 [Putridiphycobacter roseus]|uniref:Secretion system C-terminal sorting domain-containing protein n=1 Tax=Putridiphycobacter roseus TaxID=2219161 RepID=A0A2W1NMK5_9FLAO|nr:T9SS type A sorting domain-containing protein [Putridiphycobacter roseus]PZE15868.1 hypothetical protein DNU06_15925 [Putridiphycobacter roseus]
MNRLLFLVFLFFIPQIIAQTIVKPLGCYAGTNGTNPAVLAHNESRGVLITEKWADIEPSPGVYNFTTLNTKINTVTSAGLKYALAIPAGAFGSPAWLMDSLNVHFHSFQYQNQTWRLPLWWDSICEQKLTALITQLGNEFGTDTMLSHVYVSQMSVNGVEGHLNGVDLTAFSNDGFTEQKWITAAKSTTISFANAFPDKPIVFEVHEIDHDTMVPATIINDLANDASLCNRIGLGMWWISGKTTYQTDLINFISNFQGDKYAQIIGRSDQLERFKDSLYLTVFEQAKSLNIRYIEPWPYEFQYHTHDSILQDFNLWADANFSATATCPIFNAINDEVPHLNDLYIYPNPTNNFLNINLTFPFQNLEISVYNLSGKKVLTAINQLQIPISHLPNGPYLIQLNMDDRKVDKKFIKID